jgi:hypothetical protein
MENAYEQEIAAVSTAMRIGFAKIAYDWQAKQIRSIIRSALQGVVVHLLVQATGGGKSLVRDTAAFVLGGVCLTISPLLVLGSDQSSKLKTMIQAGTGIKVVHLDEITAGSVKEKQLIQDIENLPSSPAKTLLLFSSPQRISDSESWTKQLHRMIQAKFLRMVCVDEAHLYVMHGLFFRPKFFKLKEILFDKMKNSNIPVVFMTATATKDMICHIKQLSGLDILQDNITWPSSKGLQRRDVMVEVCWKERVIRDFKDLAGDILDTTEFTKIIVYTNSKAQSNELASKIRAHLNDTGLPGDVIHVDGDLFKEQKFHNIKIFLHHGTIDNPTNPLNPLDPRILVATSGAANAGIDSADVYLVLRDGFPPSIADLLQELGRAGRRLASLCIAGMIDRYRINISLKSFVSLIKRIYRAPKGDEVNQADTSRTSPQAKQAEKTCMTLKEYREHQMDNLSKVSKLLVLDPDECVACKLERAATNPFEPYVSLGKCETACSSCVCKKGLFKSVSRHGVMAVLIGVFHEENGANSTLDEELPKKIKDFPDSYNLIYGSKAKNLDLCLFKALVLQLAVSSVLMLKDDGSMDQKVCATLNPDSIRLHYREENDAAWDGIPRF